MGDKLCGKLLTKKKKKIPYVLSFLISFENFFLLFYNFHLILKVAMTARIKLK